MLYFIPDNTERNIRTTHDFTKLSVVQKIVSVNPGLKSKRGFDKHFLMAYIQCTKAKLLQGLILV